MKAMYELTGTSKQAHLAYIKRQEQRKADILNRVEAMIGYVTNKDICRQAYIANYFGENNPLPCGKCDNCIEKRKNRQKDWENIEDAIFKMLNTSALPLEVLLAKVEGYYGKQDFLSTLRFLLDENKVKINTRNEIFKV